MSASAALHGLRLCLSLDPDYRVCTAPFVAARIDEAWTPFGRMPFLAVPSKVRSHLIARSTTALEPAPINEDAVSVREKIEKRNRKMRARLMPAIRGTTRTVRHRTRRDRSPAVDGFVKW